MSRLPRKGDWLHQIYGYLPNKNPDFDTQRIEVGVLAFCLKKACKLDFLQVSKSVRLRIFYHQKAKTHLFSTAFPAIFKLVIVERMVTVEFMGVIVKLMRNRWIFGCNHEMILRFSVSIGLLCASIRLTFMKSM